MNPRASALLAVTAAMMADAASVFPPMPPLHRAHPRRLIVDPATGNCEPSPEDAARLAAAEAKRARRAARNLRGAA